MKSERCGIRKSQLQQRATDCVDAMGDIFWDAHSWTRPGEEYSEPQAVAINDVTDAMTGLVRSLGVQVDLDVQDLPSHVLRK